MEIESNVRELVSLGADQPLRDQAKLNRAKQLMRQLKEMGFTVKEIAQLSGHWSEPTIKQYTAGIKTTDTTVKSNLATILVKMINSGVDLDDIKKALAFNDQLSSQGLNTADLFKFLGEGKQAGIDATDFVEMLITLKNKDIEAEDLAEALPYITKIAEQQRYAFSPKLLIGIIEAAEKFGDATKALQAINSFASLNAIGDANKKANEKLDDLNKTIKELETKQRQIQENLELHRELTSIGYDNANLKFLKKTASKFGKLDGLLEGISVYSNLKDMRSKLDDAQKELKDVEAKIKHANAEYAQLQPSVNLCNKLLFELRCSETIVQKIYDLIKSYGASPISVIEALQKYGEIKVLKQEILNFTNDKAILDSEIAQLRETYASLKAKIDQIRNVYEGLANMLALQMNAITEKHNREITAVCQEQLKQVNHMSEELGESIANAKKHEEELRVARYFYAALRYPQQAKGIPLSYGFLMIDSAYKIFQANSFNPKAKPGEETTMYSIYGSTLSSIELPLLSLLDWVKRAAVSDARALGDITWFGGSAA